jgi:triosephosphate isomerase
VRRSIVAGNWKMNKTIPDGVELAGALSDGAGEFIDGCDVVLCPPFTAVKAVADRILGSGIDVGAQDVHWESSGAFTGEVSCEMLVDAGCSWVIIGHSERRAMFGETDDAVNKKMKAAISAGLKPVICVGETLAQREEGSASEVVRRQVRGAFAGVSGEDASRAVVAYEPVWAIGTGRASTGEDANAMARMIRDTLAELYSHDVSEAVRIQYGGSVKPGNMAEFAQQPEIDGALVGGASLKADDFIGIIRAMIDSKK